MKERVDMKVLAFGFAADCYIYASKLKATGHDSLAERLISQSLQLDYETHLTRPSFDTPEFILHLKNSYYSAARVYELLELILGMGIKCEGHEALAESAQKLRGMLHSSVTTMLAKQGINASGTFQNSSSTISKFVPPAETDQTIPESPSAKAAKAEETAQSQMPQTSQEEVPESASDTASDGSAFNSSEETSDSLSDSDGDPEEIIEMIDSEEESA